MSGRRPRFGAARWWRRAALPLGTVFGVGAALAILVAATRGEPAPRADGPGVEAPSVLAAPVEWTDGHAITRSFIGRVEARERSRVGFELGGTIDSIAFREGDRVAAGAVVARLDTVRLDARRTELVAARDRADARREIASITLRRTAEARALGAVNEQEWDAAEQALRAAEAALAGADAAIDAIDASIAKATLVSPFDAVVARRHADRGEVVDAGTPIVELLERVAPRVRVGVGGEAVRTLATDSRVTVEIGGRRVEGVVRSILPTRDRESRAVDVVVRLDAEIGGGPDEVRVGELARLAIERRVEVRGFRVPLSALTEGVRGLWAIALLEPEDRDAEHAIVRRVDVELLHQDAEHAFVRAPLEEGARFVATGLHRVAPGMRVRVAPDPTSLADASRGAP